MHFDPQERLGLFIDGAHLDAASRNLGFDVDHKNLLGFFRHQARLVRASYDTALPENDDYSPLRPLVDWLGYNGYAVVTKPAREFTEAAGRRRVRGSIEVEMAVDVLTLAPRLDNVVIFAGDGDLRRMVEAAQQQGLRVSVLSTIRAQPAMIADDLRRQADQFIDLADLAPDITRRQVEPRPRPAPARPPERLRVTPAEPVRDPVELPDQGGIGYRQAMTSPADSPGRDCPLCPRLVAYRNANRAKWPGWHNAPVPCWGPREAPLLVLGLAPGVKGANRTGRPFTGDHAGKLLYATLIEFGLARGGYREDPQDGMELAGVRIANAVRCVPPENLPTPAEVTTCNRFLLAERVAMPRLKAVLALGLVAHNALLKSYRIPVARMKFAHGAVHVLPDGVLLADSYHVSRYNTQTGRLTAEMFQAVMRDVLARIRG